MLKGNYLFLVPYIVLSIPPTDLFRQQVIIASIITIVGLAGMITRNSKAAITASACLLLLIVWGKIASDVYKGPAPDSALLLFQFMLVILLMEASTTALTFDNIYVQIRGKTDDVSTVERTHVLTWMGVQLLNLAKFTVAAFGLSLALLVTGGLISVSINQIAFSGILVLTALVAIFILLTHKREPEETERSSS